MTRWYQTVSLINNGRQMIGRGAWMKMAAVVEASINPSSPSFYNIASSFKNFSSTSHLPTLNLTHFPVLSFLFLFVRHFSLHVFIALQLSRMRPKSSVRYGWHTCTNTYCRAIKMPHRNWGMCVFIARGRAVVFHRNGAVKSLFISSLPLAAALYLRELESITAPILSGMHDRITL